MTDAPLYDIAEGPQGGRGFWLNAADGLRLRVGLWTHDGAQGTVLLLPGRTEYVEKYGRAAGDLRQRGFATLVIDWRGQGLADRALDDPMGGHVTDFAEYQLDFAEGWNARATAYYQLGQFGPSIADIGQVLTLNPRHFGALSGLGSIFEELGKPAQALEVYKAALKIDPHAPGVEEAVSRIETELQGKDL